MKTETLAPLAFTFKLSGVWDTIAGVLYIFFIGTGRLIDSLETNPFFAVFLGYFFLCFAYLQFMSAANIKSYSMNVGCLILERTFYVVLLYSYMLFVKEFPTTFWFTGIIDSVFIVLYIVFARRGGISAKELFLPKVINA